MERLIFHIDVNSAFLSWEAVRRIKEGQPDIRLIPSAIGGDPQKRTGVILAKSIPAKEYGVTTGEPVAMALSKCPQLYLASPDFSLYQRNSRAFIAICKEYAPVLSQFSIDECFLDMTGTHEIYPDPIALAYTIKDRIRDELGFTVNVGIGSNKLLAKMASDFEKPDKVHTLFDYEIQDKMWPMNVADLIFVGKSSTTRLKQLGIRTIGELASTDIRILTNNFGAKGAKMLHEYANGIDDSPVESERDDAKGYSISTTLEEDVVDRETAARVLLMLTDSVALRMRKNGMKTQCIGVNLRSYDFRNRSHQRKIAEATDVTDEIYEVVMGLFDELWKEKVPLRLLGISLTDVTMDEYSQLTFFTDERKEKAKKLDAALDSIKSKFGNDSVYRASYDTHKKH